MSTIRHNSPSSKPIAGELLSVLARRFARDREELARVAMFLSSLGEIVAATERTGALAGEPDNRVLERAAAADAEVIVTGDRALLGLAELRGPADHRAVVSPRSIGPRPR